MNIHLSFSESAREEFSQRERERGKSLFHLVRWLLCAVKTMENKLLISGLRGERERRRRFREDRTQRFQFGDEKEERGQMS